MIQSSRELCSAPLNARRVCLGILLQLGVLLAPNLVTEPAHAQGNATLAEALFDDGQKLSAQGNHQAACAKFKESQRLDPATGTLLNLAICYEKVDRLATAWATWREAASSARAANQADREEHARQKANQLQGKLARLTLHVAGVEGLPQGFVLTQDGEPQPSAAWEVALPIDAGAHHFEASAPGFLTWTLDVQVKDGQNVSVSVPILAPLGTPPLAVVPVQPVQEEPEPEEEDEEEVEEQAAQPESATVQDKKPSRGLKITGIVLTSAGAAALGVGTYFGIRALAKNADSKSNCSSVDPDLCSLTGKEQRDQARNAATAANIFIGIGAIAATTGIVFLITSSKKSDTSVSVSPAPGGGHLFLSGAF